MKIYVSHSSNFDYINKLYNPIKSSNLMASNVFFFPHDKHENGIKTKDIIGDFDLVIAEVSLPATGQGIELGWADYCNVPILCIYEKSAKISSALRFITNNIIEYNDIDDMLNKISNYIKTAI